MSGCAVLVDPSTAVEKLQGGKEKNAQIEAPHSRVHILRCPEKEARTSYHARCIPPPLAV